MFDWPVTVIPNPIDTDIWKPLSQSIARELLGLPAAIPLLLFGAVGGTNDPCKGFSVLQEALSRMRSEPMAKDIELIVFGEGEPRYPVDLGYPVHYVGHIHDDLTLRILYSAADVMLVPSAIEAFGQTAAEANACGTPVVAFDTSGLRDIVEHRRNGYLAEAFDPEDFAAGILWVYQKLAATKERFKADVRETAVKRFDYRVVAPQYQRILSRAVASRS